MLCGIPGSGKSTVAKDLPGFLVSTDSVRKFLWDGESVVKHDKLVFEVAESIIKICFPWEMMLFSMQLTLLLKDA